MSKKLFNPLFDPKKIPSFNSHFKSLDSVVGQGFKSTNQEPSDSRLFREQQLKQKYKTQQTPQILPSMKLRKEGKL